MVVKDNPAIGTMTDSDGMFTIKVSRGSTLLFSYLGYKDVEYLVTKQEQNLDIKFTESATEVEEVVVTALGTQRKISTLSAVTSVDVNDLQQPVASVANLLGGRVAGVISTMSSGEPGKNIADFWIRGIGTFGANASALVLIDGLEGDINSLDPADIESFSVLKDASATAVYGVRGANGVVLITTKRGKIDKLEITARVAFTLSHLKRLPNYVGAYEYAQLANEARAVRGEEPLYSDIEMNIIRNGRIPTSIRCELAGRDHQAQLVEAELLCQRTRRCTGGAVLPEFGCQHRGCGLQAGQVEHLQLERRLQYLFVSCQYRHQPDQDDEDLLRFGRLLEGSERARCCQYDYYGRHSVDQPSSSSHYVL